MGGVSHPLTCLLLFCNPSPFLSSHCSEIFPMLHINLKHLIGCILDQVHWWGGNSIILCDLNGAYALVLVFILHVVKAPA